ncbi:MAG: DUF4167 domain-containing protein [Alphaproteobacteria bacterium]|nr:DUF4167 domain-containing protein [Alphaproteobacteria bacterium]
MNTGGMGGGHSGRRHPGKYGFQHGGGPQRPPRKNFAALREKYMNQAKDAMSGGDRVLAEYYLQYADHYYRMQQEFLAERNARFQQSQSDTMDEFSEEPSQGSDEPEIDIPNNSNVLPAFLTRPVPNQQGGQEQASPAPPNWEEE